MDVSEAARLKALEDENAKLKRLLVEHTLQTTKIENDNCFTSTVNNPRHIRGSAAARCTSRNLSLKIFSPYSLISNQRSSWGGDSRFPLL
jgi:hypothetical protein